MKVKELPLDTDLYSVKVRIPDDLWEDAQMAGMTQQEAYLHSGWFSGVWLKEDLSSGRVFPLNASNTADWTVVEK